MRVREFLCITLLVLSHPQLWSQALTKQLPPGESVEQRDSGAAIASGASAAALATNQGGRQPGGPAAERSGQDPEHPACEIITYRAARKEAAATPRRDIADVFRPAEDESLSEEGDLPRATPIATAPAGERIRIRAGECEKREQTYTLLGEVEIEYQNLIVRADRITYNSDSGDMEARGHLQLDGGPESEHISATGGTLNLQNRTGRFHDVVGSIGARPLSHGAAYPTSNPFVFTGRVVVQDGPGRYTIYGGTVTSCSLPTPDWTLSSSQLDVDHGDAHAKNVLFRLRRVPLVYLPYATHTVNVSERQSGFLIPTFGTSSTKGTILGESIYIRLGRSADLTVGAEYYSQRGWAENADFRARGRDLNFFRFHYSGLLDRGIQLGGDGKPLVDQGGEDALITGRKDFSRHLRGVADGEYLSSYVYRQAFAENFAQATVSEVKSVGFLTRWDGTFSESLHFDRYQNFESTAQGDEVRIIQGPGLEADSVEHAIAGSRFFFGYESSLGELSRTEPLFTTSSPAFRADLHSHLSLPLLLDGWTVRPEVGARETYYSKSNAAPANTLAQVPVEVAASTNRRDLQAGFELRPPTLERIFHPAAGHELKHTVSAQMQYRFVTGIDHFARILKFDPRDLVSNTNEIEYSVTQRLYFRDRKTHPCAPEEAPDADTHDGCADQNAERLTWTVAQKHFFDPTFGNAVVDGQRNVLAATLDFTGVAFLAGPRTDSPVLSRLRLRAPGHTDVEWDLDYDSKAGRISGSNLFADYRRGDLFAGLGQWKLDAQGDRGSPGAPLNPALRYSQLRLLLGYGDPARRGLSAAANVGLDLQQNNLQYGAVQTSYNWDCCGFNVEYRRFALGSVRNENQYRFNFTLAGVGAAGNLRRAERLY